MIGPYTSASQPSVKKPPSLKPSSDDLELQRHLKYFVFVLTTLARCAATVTSKSDDIALPFLF